MTNRGLFQSGFIIITVLSLVSCRKDIGGFCDCDQEDMVASVSVFASGLNNPRGLTVGPDGYLYVAEGGIGGTHSTTGECTQVAPPIGPYTGSPDGARIVKVNWSGDVTTVAEDLPSSQTAGEGGLISGVGDVTFVGKKLYAILAGAGCSHGVKDIPNAVIRVNDDKSWDIVADLSAWQASHPVAEPPADFEPDGTWYSMTNVGANLYAVEPNKGEIVRVKANGDIERVIDMSENPGHVVPTAITFYKGNFYIGNLGVFPITGNCSVYKLTPAGDLSVVATGFSAILGIDFDKAGGMYVLENTTGNPFPTPGTGTIVRVDPSGNRRTLVTGLNLPTALVYAPDGNLYVSNWGFGPPALGGGEILKVKISCNEKSKKN